MKVCYGVVIITWIIFEVLQSHVDATDPTPTPSTTARPPDIQCQTHNRSFQLQEDTVVMVDCEAPTSHYEKIFLFVDDTITESNNNFMSGVEEILHKEGPCVLHSCDEEVCNCYKLRFFLGISFPQSSKLNVCALDSNRLAQWCTKELNINITRWMNETATNTNSSSCETQGQSTIANEVVVGTPVAIIIAVLIIIMIIIIVILVALLIKFNCRRARCCSRSHSEEPKRKKRDRVDTDTSISEMLSTTDLEQGTRS